MALNNLQHAIKPNQTKIKYVKDAESSFQPVCPVIGVLLTHQQTNLVVKGLIFTLVIWKNENILKLNKDELDSFLQ